MAWANQLKTNDLLHFIDGVLGGPEHSASGVPVTDKYVTRWNYLSVHDSHVVNYVGLIDDRRSARAVV
jgi:hypothetical protein